MGSLPGLHRVPLDVVHEPEPGVGAQGTVQPMGPVARAADHHGVDLAPEREELLLTAGTSKQLVNVTIRDSSFLH